MVNNFVQNDIKSMAIGARLRAYDALRPPSRPGRAAAKYGKGMEERAREWK